MWQVKAEGICTGLQSTTKSEACKVPACGVQQTSAQKHCGSEKIFILMPLLNTWHLVGRHVPSCFKQLHLHVKCAQERFGLGVSRIKDGCSLNAKIIFYHESFLPSVAKTVLWGNSGGAHPIPERPPLITSNPVFRCPSLSKVAHEYSFSNAKQILFFKTPLQGCLVFYICFLRYAF